MMNSVVIPKLEPTSHGDQEDLRKMELLRRGFVKLCLRNLILEEQQNLSPPIFFSKQNGLVGKSDEAASGRQLQVRT